MSRLTREAAIIPLVEKRKHDLIALGREYGVTRLDLFGSAADGLFREESSDLDFVATFADTTVGGYADRYLAFAEALETLFGRKVDLLTERSMRNPYFRRAVDANRQRIYDEPGHEAAA